MKLLFKGIILLTNIIFSFFHLFLYRIIIERNQGRNNANKCWCTYRSEKKQSFSLKHVNAI
jgi:hypothetical protein